ncbi:ribonuclease HI family protein [Staphylococcus massiliensis]|uniref:Cell wall enzyme EbsB n=1 Tax=Staphylococcus massiliensis S46 TaxID=1229783 RepID=K9AY52_9STAP|nr:ribonuclease HI family protein [Staphylococcus massiliensis]EKU47482.1 cell wall enzyme EbsB [Staphylococcus massiliensis S46]MCG3398875.1 ribonuclease HI family protein [Staphylococcus massiliensis]MCG3412257.1 ribonuclease HI family protein [Staphylococcus massiliensis]POA01424.1 ribonuclease H [Staphylococcus massiliensis CCUG 55927]
MAKIAFDAATRGNPGESVCGVVIALENERIKETKYLGITDNHSAEWEALLYALHLAIQHGVKNAFIQTDSKLVEDSILDDQVKSEKFKHYFQTYKSLEHEFDLVFVKWVPRDQNKEANQLAQQALRKMK